MKKAWFYIFLFIPVMLVSLWLFPMETHATSLDEYLYYLQSSKDYIEKWEPIYNNQMDTMYGDNDYKKLTDERMKTIINEFRNYAVEMEQNRDNMYEGNSILENEYNTSSLNNFQSACHDDSFIFSLMNLYTNFFEENKYNYQNVNDTNKTLEANPFLVFLSYEDERYIAEYLYKRAYYGLLDMTSLYGLDDSKMTYKNFLFELSFHQFNTDDYVWKDGQYGMRPNLTNKEREIARYYNLRNSNNGFYSGFAGILNVLGIDSVTESVVTSITSMLVSLSSDIIVATSESLLDFGPSLDLFMQYFGSNVGNTLSNGETLVDLNSIFKIIGYILATFIFAFFLIITAIAPGESRNSVLKLCISYIFVLIGIYFSDKIVAIVYDLALNAWNTLFEDLGVEVSAIPHLTALLFTVEYLNIPWTLNFLGVLFNLLVGWVIIKNAIFLFVEIIERYVVSCMLYFGFGTSLSTLTSENTKPIFFSYLKMIISQLLLLFLNVYFVKGFFLLLVNYDKWVYTIFGIIFVLSYLKTAQRIDSHLYALGLNTAQTGANVASTIMGVGMSMIAGAYGTYKLAKGAVRLGGKAGHLSAKAIGNAMESHAVKTGDLGAFTKGSNLKRGQIFSNNVPTLQSSQNLAFANARKNPTGNLAFKNAMNNRQVGNALNSTLGGNAASSLKANLSPNTQNILGNIKNAQFGNGGGVSFSSQNKSAGGKSHDINGTLSFSSGNGGRYVGTSSDGTALYAKTNGKPSAQIGDSFAIGISKDQNGYTMSSAEMMTGVNFSTVQGLQERLSNEDCASLHCQAGRKGNVFTITDSNNNLIGGFDSSNNYYSADRDINISEKDFAPDGAYGSLGFEDVWCCSSELDTQLNGNATLSPEELHERMTTSLENIEQDIASTNDELIDTLSQIQSTSSHMSSLDNTSDEYAQEEAILKDLQAKESSLRESIATETDYYNSVSSFKDSLDGLAENGYKDVFIGTRDGNVEMYRMENVTISDVAMNNTDNRIGPSVNFVPLGAMDKGKLNL